MRFRRNIFLLGVTLLAGLACAAEFAVPVNPVKDQERVAVAQLANDGIVFTWQDESNGIAEIWFRRYDSNLVALAAPVRAHAATTNLQCDPVVAPLTNGFVLAWAALGLDGNSYGIAYRRFDLAGNPLDAGVLQANSNNKNAQLWPDIAPLAGGRFVIVWSDQSAAFQADADQDVRYRRFNSDGTPLDPVDLVANAWGIDARVPGNQGSPRVASLSNGGFVIVYEDRESEDVFAVRFDGAGNPLPVPSLPVGSYQLRVNVTLPNVQWAPAVGSFGNDAFAVVFNSEPGGTTTGRRVLARVFHPGGFGSNEMVLGSYASRVQDARVAALPDGNFVTTMQAWNVGPDAGSNWWSVAAQRARTNNALVAPSFLVHSYHTNDQDRPAIAALRDGSYVLAWQSYGQDGDRYGVYAQRYTAAGEPGGGRLHISRIAGETNLLVRFTNATPYAQYRLQAAPDFTNWTTLLTTNTTSGSFQFTETKVGKPPARTYRAVSP